MFKTKVYFEMKNFHDMEIFKCKENNCVVMKLKYYLQYYKIERTYKGWKI